MKSSVIFSAIVYLFSNAAIASIIQAAPANNTPQIAKFAAEVEAKLPAQIKAKLANQKIILQFAKLDNENKVVIPNCSNVVDSMIEAKGATAQYAKAAGKRQIRYNQQIQSVTSGNTITLNANFLSVIANGEYRAQTYGCDLKNTYKLAQGSLINGIARIYDNQTNLSESLQYKYIAGWNAKKLMQSFWPRAVNPYEYAGTTKDHFATNMEFYLLDSEYACRRPVLQEFFTKYVGSDTLASTRNCEINTVLPIPSEEVKQGVDEATGMPIEKTIPVLKTYDLNPDHVYDVYYMRASMGNGIGGFGHSMFRVVVCPPNMSVSKECDKVIREDLVFNPRANPNEMRLDNLKGVFGGYPSQFLVNSVYDLQEEYGDSELRHLFNMPLGHKNAQGQFEPMMLQDQKKRMIYSAIESYWAYYGNYKFITNNCADEAMRLYQMSSTDPNVLKLSVMKPADVNKKLSALGYIDDSEVKLYEKTPGLIGKIFHRGKIKNQAEYNERRKLIEDSRHENAFVSRIYDLEDAVREIMKLEGNPNPDFKAARKEIQKWMALATPDFQWSDDDTPLTEAQMSDAQKKEILKNTFYQIKARYQALYNSAKTPQEKKNITFYFHRLMFYVYNNRAEKVGNEAVQIAYAVAYPSKDRSVKEMPKDIKITKEQFDTIRGALDKYTDSENKLMPYREASVKLGYGIPLKTDVVRGDEYLALKEGENDLTKDLIDALGALLGPEHVILKDIGKFYDELRAQRFKDRADTLGLANK